MRKLPDYLNEEEVNQISDLAGNGDENERLLNRILFELYRVTTEESRAVGAQKVQVFVSSIVCIAVFLTFMGLVITQFDKVVSSFSFAIIGFVIIGIIILLFLISFVGYHIILRNIGQKLASTAMSIEKLQQDVILGKIEPEELKKKLVDIFPYSSVYENIEDLKKFRWYPKKP